MPTGLPACSGPSPGHRAGATRSGAARPSRRGRRGEVLGRKRSEFRGGDVDDMNVGGRPMRTIWLASDRRIGVEIIDQTQAAARAGGRRTGETPSIDVANMRSALGAGARGPPLIGVTAAYGIALANARGSVRRGIGASSGDLGRNPSHGSQFTLGARRNGACACARVLAAAAVGCVRRRPHSGPAKSPRPMSRSAVPSASMVFR